MKKGWSIKRLADLLELQNGYAFDSKGFNPTDGIPLIRIRSLKAGTETETRFRGDYEKKYVVKAGDLLIGMDGEFGCYEWKGEPALLNQRVCRLQKFTGELIPRFLFYGVNDYLKAIEDVTGYTTVKHLSSKQILEIRFPVPPLDEQKRIVAKLDEAFTGLAKAKENAEKNLQNARALFESHLQSVFTQRGPGWQSKRLDEVCAFDKAQGSHRGLPYVGLEHIESHTARFIGSAEPQIVKSTTFRFTKEHVLYGRLRPYLNKALIPKFEGHCSTEIFPLRPSRELMREYLLFWLLDNATCERINNTSRGARMPRAKMDEVMSFDIPLPTLDKQKRIVETLENLRERTQRIARIYERKHAALEALKKSLLHQAFAGEL